MSESRGRRLVYDAFTRWVRHQDPAAFRSLSSVSAFLSAALAIFLIVAVGAWVPFTSDFIGLRGVEALLTFVPALVSGVTLALKYQNEPILPPRAWLFVLINSGLVQFFAASLIVLSSPAAAPIFGLLLLITTAQHGVAHRFTLTEPFGPVITLGAGLAAAGLFSTSIQNLSVLAIVSLAGGFISVALGQAALQRDLALEERERLRAAIHAQVLHEQSKEIEALSESLVEVLGRNHDLRNVTLSVSANTQVLTAMAGAADSAFSDELKETIADLGQGVKRLTGLVEEVLDRALRSRAGSVKEGEVVDVAPILGEVAVMTRSLFRNVRIEVDARADQGLSVLASGGAQTVYRVLQNLLLNACEGSGPEGASEVILRCYPHSSGGILVIEVYDNGPGFPEHQLDRGVRAFETTKSMGSGLGLYVVERLVLASGGRMSRSNRPEGGAWVRIEMPRRGA